MTGLKLPKMKKPFTPIMRRFLHDVFKPSNNLGKRGRDQDEDFENTPPTGLLFPVQGEHRKSNCLALQNEDIEEDAVIITALNTVPFCCHADLLTMSREQLVNVATSLNAKLPLAMQIDTGENRTENFIRNSVEILVGIRRDVPPAPKVKRSHDMSFTPSGELADTSSTSLQRSNSVTPIAVRKRSNTSSFADASGTPRLASLREEIEERSPSYRPMKRRRIAEPAPIPSFIPGSRAVTRSQSHRVRVAPLRPKMSATRYTSARVLRSQSQRLPDIEFAAAHRYVTTTRGSGRTRSQSTVVTSTPNAKFQAVGRAAILEDILDSNEDLSFTSPSIVSTSTNEDCTPGLERVKDWLNQSTSGNGSDDAVEVTSGIQAIAMSSITSSSNMDISAE